MKTMETIVKAIDKAVRAGGVYTLDEVATILSELNKLGSIVAAYEKAEKEKTEKAEAKKEED